MFSGTLSLAFTILLALVLPYAERSAHNADVLTSLMLAMQTLLTAGFGDEDDGFFLCVCLCLCLCLWLWLCLCMCLCLCVS